MTHTDLPLRRSDYTVPAGNMVTLPSIQKLGLLGLGGPGRPPSPSHQAFSQTWSSSSYSHRLYESVDKTWTAQSLSQPTYTRSSTSAVSTKRSIPAPLSLGVTGRAPGIFALEPRVTPSQQDVFEEYSSSQDRRSDLRRGSSDSVLSTPSLHGSFAGSCDGNSPALMPSTPQDSPYLGDLGGFGKDYLLVEGPAELDDWPRPAFQIPFSANPTRSTRVPRRNATQQKTTPSPTLGSLQPACRVQKKGRAKPRSAVPGQAHINEKYTTEESLFLIYVKVDRNMSWKQIEAAFNDRFTRDGLRPYRTHQGLESEFYRNNKVTPVLTEDGLLVFGPRTEAEAKACPYNEYDNLTFDNPMRSGMRVTVIQRYAEQVVEQHLDWISPEEMAEARRLADLRRPHRLAWEQWKSTNPLPAKPIETEKETETASPSPSPRL